MSTPSFGRPIWLVQLSLLEAPAVVRLRTPRPRISHPQSIFFFHISFSFPASFFLSIGRLRADRCLPGEIGAPWGMPFRWVVPFSVFSIQCPPPCVWVRKSSSSISLRNAIKKSNSFSRHLTNNIGLLSH